MIKDLTKKEIENLRASASPCPFCKKQPHVEPTDPSKCGNAWGIVTCIEKDCPAQPTVNDGIDVCDERGTIKYIKSAIKRWNGAEPN